MKKEGEVIIKIPLKHLKDVCRYYEFPLAVLISSDVKLPKGTRKLHFDYKIEKLKSWILKNEEFGYRESKHLLHKINEVFG